MLTGFRTKRRELVRTLEKMQRTTERDKRDLTAEEKAEWDRTVSEIDTLDDQYAETLDQREAPSGADYHFSGQRERDILANPAQIGAAGIITDGNGTAEKPSGPCRDRTFRGMFGAPKTGLHGFRSRAEFFDVLHSGRHDARLVRAMSTITDGYAVPDELVAWFMDASLENEVMRPGASVFPMTTETKKFALWNGNNHSSALFGGITAAWTAELATITASDGATRNSVLHAHKLAILTNISNELAADGMTIDEQLSGALIKALGWNLDDATLNGTGAGMPLGALNAPSLVTVSKEAGQASTTLIYQNLAKMFARMHPGCIGNSVWIANPTTIPSLMQLTINVGTAGSHIPAMTESAGQFRLLTRPVLFTEKLPALGTVGDILLIDRSQYAIGLRKDLSVEKSAHAGFANDSTYYRAIMRGDGMPIWSTAVTPAAGDTLSWAVALATRS